MYLEYGIQNTCCNGFFFLITIKQNIKCLFSVNKAEQYYPSTEICIHVTLGINVLPDSSASIILIHAVYLKKHVIKK